jgi:hypothetical protein
MSAERAEQLISFYAPLRGNSQAAITEATAALQAAYLWRETIDDILLALTFCDEFTRSHIAIALPVLLGRHEIAADNVPGYQSALIEILSQDSSELSRRLFADSALELLKRFKPA